MSNVTPKPSTKKTKLELRLTTKYSLVLLLIVVAGFLLVPTHSSRSSTQLTNMGKTRYAMEVASTEQARRKGLSGRASMPRNKGMLFVFDAPDKACFWMKDMHFALDIIWLDSAKKVVHIEKYVLPATFPHNFCAVQPAKYVIELNAGEVDHSGIKLGQTLSL